MLNNNKIWLLFFFFFFFLNQTLNLNPSISHSPNVFNICESLQWIVSVVKIVHLKWCQVNKNIGAQMWTHRCRWKASKSCNFCNSICATCVPFLTLVEVKYVLMLLWLCLSSSHPPLNVAFERSLKSKNFLQLCRRNYGTIDISQLHSGIIIGSCSFWPKYLWRC